MSRLISKRYPVSKTAMAKLGFKSQTPCSAIQDLYNFPTTAFKWKGPAIRKARVNRKIGLGWVDDFGRFNNFQSYRDL